LRKARFIPAAGVFIIFFPCLIEGFELVAFKEMPEVVDCNLMFFKGSFKHIATLDKHEPLGMLERCEFGGKGIAQSLRGKLFIGIELLSVFIPSGDDTGKQSSKQDRECEQEQFFDHIFWLTILLCCLWLGADEENPRRGYLLDTLVGARTYNYVYALCLRQQLLYRPSLPCLLKGILAHSKTLENQEGIHALDILR
jgi:hypothetical protein